MKRFCLLPLLAVIAFGCATAPVQPEAQPRALTKAEGELVAADNGFGMMLLTRLHEAQPAENVVISPVSISMALGMTLNGARSETYDSMRATLGFAGLTQEEINTSYGSLMQLVTHLDSKVEVTVANSVWYDTRQLAVDTTFSRTLATYFNADTRGLDFSSPTAVPAINGWVSANTKGKIPEIVTPPIDPSMVMFLIDALYFKGGWRAKFDPALTHDGTFTLADGSTVPCRMMSRSGGYRRRYGALNGITVVDLPYGNGRYSMTIVLPPSTQQLSGVIASLTPAVWSSWVDSLRDVGHEDEIELPKFTLRYDRKLNDALTSLGMGIAFSDRADLSGIRAGHEPNNLTISEVRHKVYIDVDEEGTEAAAATSVGISTTSVPAPIRVNRPFILAIREQTTGAILFLGTVMNPA
ncbi:MAG TPA: serpin family protein [Candidatus Kapabacteria bacterium]|nr:serpin family protein [Candidatus Kapabacteria bacterium]